MSLDEAVISVDEDIIISVEELVMSDEDIVGVTTVVVVVVPPAGIIGTEEFPVTRITPLFGAISVGCVRA
jgi:hypothetical protein